MPCPYEIRGATRGVGVNARGQMVRTRPPAAGGRAKRVAAACPRRLPGDRIRRIKSGPEFNPWSPRGRPSEEAEMKRLLVFACAAALLAGCVPEDLSSLLPTVQSGSLGKDVFLFEDAIVSNDVVEGDLFAWGTTVEINGQVDGSIYVYGREVKLNAPAGGSVTGLGREIALPHT